MGGNTKQKIIKLKLKLENVHSKILQNKITLHAK